MNRQEDFWWAVRAAAVALLLWNGAVAVKLATAPRSPSASLAGR